MGLAWASAPVAGAGSPVISLRSTFWASAMRSLSALTDKSTRSAKPRNAAIPAAFRRFRAAVGHNPHLGAGEILPTVRAEGTADWAPRQTAARAGL